MPHDRASIYFDRYDTCEAFYAYMVDYHGGQSSKEYRLTGVFAKLRFKPGAAVREQGRLGLTDNGRAIYDALALGTHTLRDRR